MAWSRVSLGTHFGVFKLLFDIIYKTVADLADEATEEQFRAHFTGTCNSTTDTHQGADLVCPKVTDSGYKRQVVKGNVEFSRLEIGRVSGSCRWIDFEIFRLKFRDKIEERPAEVRKESVVLFLYRVS